MSKSQNTTNDNLVIIDFKDLLLKTPSNADRDGGANTFSSNKNMTAEHQRLHSLLNKAFGTASPSSTSESLGLIAIRNIPSFLKAKEAFLPLAHTLATLPPQDLNQYLTDESSMYNAGWSHGKEKLKNDEPDLSKGSFYFNPIVDEPGTEEERKLYPASYPVNKWPNRDPVMIPQFEQLGKELGCIMKDVVALLAKHIDEYVKFRCETYDVCIGKEMKNTQKVKGRLLYYFPKDHLDHDDNGKEGQDLDSWIGWHNDSGFLTALAGDIYVDHDTGEIIPKDSSDDIIDPKAGLYIQDRNGHVQQIRIPDDCMAVQIGECLQIVTGGHVVATPHCVRGADPNWKCSSVDTTTNNNNRKDVGANKRKIARISFPCFVDTEPSFPLAIPSGRSKNDVINSGVVGCAKVPPLEKRWIENGMDFGSFLQKTFALYYDWSKTT